MKFPEPDYIESRCPQCKGRVEIRADCPGYGNNPVKVCWPPESCGNATYFECAGEKDRDSCGWFYRDPPGKRSDIERMGEKPDWLEQETWQ